MQEGLYLKQRTSYIEKYEKESAEIRLLAKGDGTEVMLQRIKSGEVFFVNPGEASELLEFFFILEGQVLYEGDREEVVLGPEDYFYVHHLKNTVQFKAVSDVLLLYISSRPVFYQISRSIRELSEIAKKCYIKDAYTHDHGDRVKHYAVKIANRLNLSKERIENIAFASLFHDIGKIKIPDEVLKKPGALDDDEFKLIKKHPLDGREMVRETYYEGIGDIINQHHERLDGSGYPNGLKDGEIMLEAKIIAVADAFDAMTTDRPYRKALTPQEALQELKKFAGKYYDKKVVESLEHVLVDENIIRR